MKNWLKNIAKLGFFLGKGLLLLLLTLAIVALVMWFFPHNDINNYQSLLNNYWVKISILRIFVLAIICLLIFPYFIDRKLKEANFEFTEISNEMDHLPEITKEIEADYEYMQYKMLYWQELSLWKHKLILSAVGVEAFIQFIFWLNT